MAVIIDGKVGAIQTSFYVPGIQDTTDLVPGAPYVIVAGAEPAAADFTVPLAIPAPADARWLVNAIALALYTNVTVADGNLRIRVYVDAQDPLLMVFDRTIAGAVFDGEDATTSPVWIPDAFALLSDGLAHDLLFFLWKDGMGVGAQIDLLELFEGVGSGEAAGAVECLQFTGIRGLATVSGNFAARVGGMGASQTNIICSPAGAGWGGDVLTFGPTAGDQPLSVVEGGGNWFNTRPVHMLGSFGVVTQMTTPGFVALVEYLRVIWQESE